MLNKNMVFCFTGKGPLPRSEMQAMAINAGASITKDVTSATTILVIMDMNSQSNKARKARENGIELIGPKTFFAMCDNKQNLYSSLHPESNIKKEVESEKKIIAEAIKTPLRRIVL